MLTPELKPVPLSVKTNVPFWLLLPPGTVLTLIWSPSFSRRIIVKTSFDGVIAPYLGQTIRKCVDGPEECDG